MRDDQAESGIDRDRIDSGWIALVHSKATGWIREQRARAQAPGGYGPNPIEAVDPNQLSLFEPTPVAPHARQDPSAFARRAPLVILAAMVAAWALVFGYLAWLRHDRIATFGLDMGIYDQATWLLSRFGTQFISVRGLSVFGHHATFGLYLFAPFYWLGAGAHFLNIAQVAVCAAGAVPVYLLARHRLGSGWMAVFLAASYLLHPSLGFLMWEEFHPETIAITPLLFAYYFAVRERWVWFAACAVIAVSFKEDVALAVVMLGLLIAVRGHRKVGLMTLGAALGWFFLVTRVMLPYFNGSKAFYISFLGNLGDTMPEIAWNLVAHPTRLIRAVTAPDAVTYLYKMTAPFAFLPLAAPLVVGLGVPQAAINVLSVQPFTRVITYHYAAIPLAALTLGVVEAVWLTTGRPALRRLLVAGVVVSSYVAATSWGLSPIGDEYRKGWWPLGADSRGASKEAALALIPDGAAVSATYHFVPQLSHRKLIYEYPNPFKSSNWGVDGTDYEGLAPAEWVILDRDVIGTADRAIADNLFSSGEFTAVFDQDHIVVGRRARPPGPSG